MDSAANIILEINSSIGIIRLHNPPQNYLLKPAFIHLTLLKKWISDNKLKGLIITGSGRHFSAGASQENLFSESFIKIIPEEMLKGKKLLSYISNLNIPVFAAIKGICFGGGLEIALASHIRICDPKALFAFPESNLDLMPGLGGTIMISNLTDKMDTLRLLLGGDMINSEEAKTMKIVDHISEEPEQYCLSQLQKMTSDRSLKVINFVMQAIHNAECISRDVALKEETKMFCELARDEGKRRKTEKND